MAFFGKKVANFDILHTTLSHCIGGGGGQICPPNEIGYIGYNFALYASKMGSRDLGRQKSTFIGSMTCLGPSMDPAMALLYCIVGLWQGPWKDHGGF